MRLCGTSNVIVSVVISKPPPKPISLASNLTSLLLVSITGSNVAPFPFPPVRATDTRTSTSNSCGST